MNLPIHGRGEGLRVRAAIHLAMWIFGLGSILVGTAAVMVRDVAWLAPAAVLTLLFAMTWLVHAVDNGRDCCPACRHPLFGSRKRQRHPKTKPLLGSCRLRLSVEIFSQDRYHCPICNQQVACPKGNAAPEGGKARNLKGFSSRTPRQS